MAYVEQNRTKINGEDSVTMAIRKLPPKEYANLKEVEDELLK